MTEPAELQTLLGYMPPPTESDTTVDWDRMAESWGTPFPAAYRRFIEIYGPGYIQDYLVIGKPEPWAEPSEGKPSDMRAGTATVQAQWREARREHNLEGTAPRLIYWGTDSSADNLCWDATDPDPERWPVLVYNRGDDTWRRYDCGMVEFLVRHLEGDFPACPLGDIYLFGRKQAAFLTHTEYMRRLRAGLDPWTGDPY
ncbi:hypothetical protein [Actinoplanes sp. NPDC049316]|uniref:hypothetical protein n=1 Tax=Actinoplanes sp. NPDC049316 TaxID=3154727 RepID=UPI00341D4389